MAIKEKYVGKINILHKANQTLTAGEPVTYDASGNIIPATAGACAGLVAQTVVAVDGKYSGSASVSLDSVTAVGRVGDPAGVYEMGGVFLTDMIQDASVAVGDKLYVDTANRKLSKVNPGGSGLQVAIVEAPKDANGLVGIKLLV